MFCFSAHSFGEIPIRPCDMKVWRLQVDNSSFKSLHTEFVPIHSIGSESQQTISGQKEGSDYTTVHVVF